MPPFVFLLLLVFQAYYPMFSSKHLVGQKLFFALVLGLFDLGCFGQQYDENSSPTSSDFFAKYFPGGNLYRVQQSDSGLSVGFQADFGVISVDYRFLAFPEVQNELDLTDDQKRKLNPIFREIFEYDSVWKWELGCKCSPAREQAANQLNGLQADLAHRKPLIGLLTKEQIARLDQLENRFFLFAVDEIRGSLGAKFLEPLSIDSRQAVKISKIVARAMEDISESNSDWEKNELGNFLESCLEKDRCGLLCDISGESWFSSEPLIRYEQMSTLFSYADVEQEYENTATSLNSNATDDTIAFEIIDPVVLPNGRISSMHDYFYRSKLSLGQSKWQRLAILLVSKDLEWFSLVDSQREAFEALVKKEEAQEGAFAYQFAGEGVPFPRKEAFSDLKAYRAYNEERFEYWRKLDSKIEDTIRSTLVRSQLDSLQLSIGADCFERLGVFVVLTEELLGSEFSLSEKDLSRLKKLVAARRLVELKELQKIEAEVFDELSEQQQVVFSKLFGEPTAIFPPFVSHWSLGRISKISK